MKVYILSIPVSTVRDDFPSFSNINCLVHLYVDILQFLIVSILDACDLINAESPFWDGLVGVERLDGAEKIMVVIKAKINQNE